MLINNLNIIFQTLKRKVKSKIVGFFLYERCGGVENL